MILFTERHYTEKEKNILKSKKYDFGDYLYKFFFNWIFIGLIVNVPFLILRKYVISVNTSTELIIVIVLQLLSIIIVIYFLKKNGDLSWNRKIEDEIEKGKASITRIESNRVIKRDDTYDVGDGYYFEIEEKKLIYLQGQIYDQLELENVFPNTSFEIVKCPTILNEIISINLLGKKISPEKTLKAYSKEEIKARNIHFDGQIIDIKIDEVK